MKYHQLLGTAESRMTADEIERTALDTGNLLALAALQVMQNDISEISDEIGDEIDAINERVNALRIHQANLKTKE